MHRLEPVLGKIDDRLKQLAVDSEIERCGFVMPDGELVEVENVSAHPKYHFEITERFPRFAVACWHTHTEEGLPYPSEPDKKQARFSGIDFIVGTTKASYIVYSRKFDYVGRQHCFNWYDCLSLVSDYWFQEYGFVLPYFSRPTDYLKTDRDYIARRAKEAGMVVFDYPKNGNLDELLVEGCGIVTQDRLHSHLMVYVGGGNVLHHPMRSLSRIEIFNGKMQEHSAYLIHPSIKP